jgi:hypothetical protein
MTRLHAPAPKPSGDLAAAVSARSTRISARDFVRDISAARRAAHAAPVLITVRGTPTEVLMSYADYERLKGGSAPTAARNIVDLIAMTPGEGAEDIEFEPPRMTFVPQLPDLDD